jgi:hypothetical protein
VPEDYDLPGRSLLHRTQIMVVPGEGFERRTHVFKP